MPDKGKVMSQTYYEKQSKLYKLYQESFVRKEMNVKESVTALRMIGFSEKIAANRVKEWATDIVIPETDRDKKLRLKQQVSLENYIIRMRFGKIFYKEYMELWAKFKNKELSKEDTIIKLIEIGYSRKFSECILDNWEAECEKNREPL